MLLTPQDPQAVIDQANVRRILREAGFSDGPLPGTESSFLAGNRFLSLITFAGCSVQLELRPSNTSGERFCHIRFSGPYRQPVLRHGRNTRPPRCPSCRAPDREWRDHCLHGAGRGVEPIQCASCGTPSLPWFWDWKETGGYGRGFVEIEEIFPGEASPTPALISLLEGIADIPWRHFYVQD